MKKEKLYLLIAAFVIIIITIAVFVLLFFFPIPESNQSVVFTSIGVLLGWSGTVISFYWGSSKSSADKTEALAKAEQGAQ